jgi:hypothetical protein
MHERASMHHWIPAATMCVRHTAALPFTLKKSILRQKKNYENSKYFFTMQKSYLQKIL